MDDEITKDSKVPSCQKWSTRIRATINWLFDLKFYSDKPVYTHKVFWLVVLLPIIIALYFAAPLSHGLVF